MYKAVATVNTRGQSDTPNTWYFYRENANLNFSFLPSYDFLLLTLPYSEEKKHDQSYENIKKFCFNGFDLVGTAQTHSYKG